MNGWRALDESACGQFQWPGLESRRSAAQDPRPHVRGKGLGGSSVVNGMIAIHAMADDYERWAAEGCPGWTFEDILPYRRRMESDLNFGDRPYHGSDGPMPIAAVGPRGMGTRSTRRSPRARPRRATNGARTTALPPAPASRRTASARATARA